VEFSAIYFTCFACPLALLLSGFFFCDLNLDSFNISCSFTLCLKRWLLESVISICGAQGKLKVKIAFSDFVCLRWQGDALFQTHENLEHLAMMERVLGPIPVHMIKRAECVLSSLFPFLFGYPGHCFVNYHFLCLYVLINVCINFAFGNTVACST